MKTLFSALLFLSLISSHTVKAEDSDEITPQQAYLVACGSIEDIKAEFKDDLSEDSEDSEDEAEQIAELKEGRAYTIDILKNGQSGFDKLVIEANKNDMSWLGVLMVCGPIYQAKDLILDKGCYDFESEAYAKDNGGVAVCENFIKALENQSKE